MGIEASNHSNSVASCWSEPLRSRNCTPQPVLAAYKGSTATVRAFLALLLRKMMEAGTPRALQEAILSLPVNTPEAESRSMPHRKAVGLKRPV
jgi:hypothetical protein